MSRIVVGVDGSDNGAVALRWAAERGERRGEEVVTPPTSVVGAICPPVMPYTPLLTNTTVIFSPRAAACRISLPPIAARSPSPW